MCIFAQKEAQTKWKQTSYTSVCCDCVNVHVPYACWKHDAQRIPHLVSDARRPGALTQTATLSHACCCWLAEAWKGQCQREHEAGAPAWQGNYCEWDIRESMELNKKPVDGKILVKVLNLCSCHRPVHPKTGQDNPLWQVVEYSLCNENWGICSSKQWSSKVSQFKDCQETSSLHQRRISAHFFSKASWLVWVKAQNVSK